MGSLDPTDRELSLLAQMQLEAGRMKGTEVSIEFVESTTLNNQHDPEYSFSLPENLDIILQERPDKELLRSLDWYNEDEENQPIIAYITKEDLNGNNIDILLGTEVVINYDIQDSVGNRRFEIGKVKMIPPGSLVYVVQLVPVRDEYDYDTPVSNNIDQDSGYSILKVDEEDESVQA